MPVIGLVQVGWQAGADRYTYWPAMGLVAAVVLTLSRQIDKVPARKFALVAFGGLLAFANLGLTAWQLPHWRNAETLGTRALEVTKQNTVGYQLRGKYYYDQGRREEALREFQQAVRLGGSYVPSAASGGNADFPPEQIGAERESRLPLLPGSAPAHNDLGNLLSELGRKEEALQHYRAASRLSSYSAEPYNNVAVTLAELGRFPEALAAHAKAIELAPDAARSYYLAGKTYWRMGQGAEAARHFRQALAVAPQDYQSLTMLARILATTPDAALRNGTEAVALAQRATELTGQQQPLVLDVLAMAYAEQGNFVAAQKTIDQAIKLATAAQATNLVAEFRTHAAAFTVQKAWRQTNSMPILPQP